MPEALPLAAFVREIPMRRVPASSAEAQLYELGDRPCADWRWTAPTCTRSPNLLSNAARHARARPARCACGGGAPHAGRSKARAGRRSGLRRGDAGAPVRTFHHHPGVPGLDCTYRAAELAGGQRRHPGALSTPGADFIPTASQQPYDPGRLPQWPCAADVPVVDDEDDIWEPLEPR